jgi:hypothetical protein
VIELKLHINSMPMLLKVATALAAVAPEVLLSAETTGQQDHQTKVAQLQEAARQSVQSGTAAGTGAAGTPTAEVKRGPGRPSKAEQEAKAAAAAKAAPAPAPEKPSEPALTYANSGISERIGVLAADPEAKATLLAKIKEVGGVGEENGKQKTSAKFIPADKLAGFRDWLNETFPVAVDEPEDEDEGIS